MTPRRPLLAFIAACGFLGTAAAEPPPDLPAETSVFLSLEVDDLSHDDGSDNGRGLTFDVSHRLRGGARASAGFALFRLADSDWGYSRLRLDLPRGRRTTWHGEARLGPGSRGDVRFTYFLAAGGATFELVPRRLWLGVEDRYLEIDRSKGNLASLSLILVPSRRLTTRLDLYASTGGNLRSDYLSGRLDLAVARLRLFGGGTLGRVRPELLDLVRGDGTTDVEEVFFGVAVPAASRELTLTLGLRELDDIRQLTLTTGLRIRVKSNPVP